MSAGPQDSEQHHLDEPTKVAQANPGPCPKPDGCKCVWTPLNHGWLRGYSSRCTVH